jgi:type II secretory pathway component PulK
LQQESNIVKKLVIATLIAVTAAFSISTGADAKPLKIHPWKHHHNHHNGEWLALGAGVAALGIIAASQRHDRVYVSDCWMEKQVRYDRWGNRHFRRIRVCD